MDEPIDEVSAMAELLLCDFGFQQSMLLMAYQLDSWNFMKNGKHVGADVEGAEHYGYVVRWTDGDGEKESDFREEAFLTPRQAAEFYIAKRKEMKL